MKNLTLIIAIACMTETLNGKFIDAYIPNYTNQYWGTQKGTELYIDLIENFKTQGFTHVHYEGFDIMSIESFIKFIT